LNLQPRDAGVQLIVTLRNGTEIDVSGLDPAAAVERLRELGVRAGMIERTKHRIAFTIGDARPAAGAIGDAGAAATPAREESR
jgi:hypothetical protein